MQWIEKRGIRLGIFPSLPLVAPGLKLFFASRTGGFSRPPYDSLNLGGSVGDSGESVGRNRQKLLEVTGVDRGSLARASQVHGSDIGIVGRGGLHRDVDGLITSKRGISLAISTADCFPVFIYSPPERVLAAIHVGRSGAVSGIIEKAAGILAGRYRADLRRAVAVIGPGICRSCYTVSGGDAAQFPQQCVSNRNGLHQLDISSFCVSELRRAGIAGTGIIRAGICTSCSPELCYSYRRDGGVTGRHWTVASMGERL